MKNKEILIIYGDGVHDDTEVLQAFLNGEVELIYPNGKRFYGFINFFDFIYCEKDREFLITKTLEM